MYVAANRLHNLQLVVWLVDVKGADVNELGGETVLGSADLLSLDIFNFLLDRGADPNLSDFGGISPLMLNSVKARRDQVRRLLQDPRARATINTQDRFNGNTALHYACANTYDNGTLVCSTVRLLLKAGANPKITNKAGQTTLASIYPTQPFPPSHHHCPSYYDKPRRPRRSRPPHQGPRDTHFQQECNPTTLPTKPCPSKQTLAVPGGTAGECAGKNAGQGP